MAQSNWVNLASGTTTQSIDAGQLTASGAPALLAQP
jgi:hypothetical protein